jgi:hypothetical protein
MDRAVRPEGGRVDMRKLLAGTTAILMLVLSACATHASRTFTVEADQHSMQYTSGQIREFLIERGFRRVRFKAFDNQVVVYEKRTAETNEQRFRFEAAPQIEVVIRVEKIRHTFVESKPRIVVIFKENNSSSLSEIAREEYDRLLGQVVEQAGANRVKE